MSRVVEWAVRAWAVWLACCAVLWVALSIGEVPGMWWLIRRLRLSVPHLDSGPLDGLFTGPIFGAMFTDGETSRRIGELSGELTDVQAVNEANNRAQETGGDYVQLGDVNLGWSVQVMDLNLAQDLLWIGLHVVPLLVMAWVWWTLAAVIRQSRSTSPFTTQNSQRLSLAGLVILVGAPLVSFIYWVLYRWVLDSTQLADSMEVPPFGLGSLPWAAVAIGAGLLILGGVWARGARLEYDVAGLV